MNSNCSFGAAMVAPSYSHRAHSPSSCAADPPPANSNASYEEQRSTVMERLVRLRRVTRIKCHFHYEQCLTQREEMSNSKLKKCLPSTLHNATALDHIGVKASHRYSSFYTPLFKRTGLLFLLCNVSAHQQAAR